MITKSEKWETFKKNKLIQIPEQNYSGIFCIKLYMYKIIQEKFLRKFFEINFLNKNINQ